MPVKNICYCHNPPGGPVECEPHQMAICTVLNGNVIRGCQDPSSSGNGTALVNWALSHITGTRRSTSNAVREVDFQILEKGTFTRRDGAVVTFALPDSIIAAVAKLRSESESGSEMGATSA